MTAEDQSTTVYFYERNSRGEPRLRRVSPEPRDKRLLSREEQRRIEQEQSYTVTSHLHYPPSGGRDVWVVTAPDGTRWTRPADFSFYVRGSLEKDKRRVVHEVIEREKAQGKKVRRVIVGN